MKIQFSVLALLSSSVLFRYKNTVSAQSQEDIDEWNDEYEDYTDENGEEEIVYDTEAEKAAWIYGLPGDPDF